MLRQSQSLSLAFVQRVLLAELAACRRGILFYAHGGPVTEREQIREILLSAGVDNETPTIDGKTELEWMTESCPSVRYAIEEAARRAARSQ